jgi:outer membrane protein/S-layer protein transport system outer membrane protein
MSGLRLGRLRLCSTCALAFATFAFSANPSRAESLADAIAEAYRTNPGIQAQRAALRALDETYVQARSQFGLQANAQFNQSYTELNRGGTPAPFGSGGEFKADTSDVGLTLQQPIYTGGRFSARANAAENDIMAGRENLRRAEIDLILRVVNAYVGVRRDQQVLQITRDTVKVLTQQLQDTRDKFAVRQVTATDVAQSEARLAQAKTQLVNAQAQLNVTRSQFVALVGHNPDNLEPEPPFDSLPQTVDQAFDAAEQLNPNLLAAKFTEAASRARVAEAKAGRRPTVVLRAERSRGPTLPYTPKPYEDSVSVSAVVSQPLFTSGQISSSIRQSVEQNNRDRLNIEDMRRNVVQSVSQAWESLAASRSSIISLEAEMRANETAFYGVREEERVGLRSNIEVLNAQQELTQAQLGLVRNRANEYSARVQLLGILGALNVDTLAPEAETYDPSRNFRRVKNRYALPWEFPLRAIDRAAGPPIGGPRKADTKEAARPNALGDMPPPPAPAAEAPPITSITVIMEKTGRRPDAEAEAAAADPGAPVTTNRN